MGTTTTVKKTTLVSTKEITEVINLHLTLSRSWIAKAFEIGKRLTSIKEKVLAKAPGTWGKWQAENLSQISQESISNYIRLWANVDFLQEKFRFQVSSNMDVKKLPSWEEAMNAVRVKDGNAKRGEPKKADPNSANSKKNEAKEANIAKGSSTGVRPEGNNVVNPAKLVYNIATFAATAMKDWEVNARDYAKRGVSAKEIVDETVSYANKWFKAYTTVQKSVVK
jgi:hypothetical protein